MVLPDARKLGIGGEVAWMRHMWQVPIYEIALRTSEVHEKSGERIARLDSPHRYRLTQLIAQVFSDIGLPDAEDNVAQSVEEVYSNV